MTMSFETRWQLDHSLYQKIDRTSPDRWTRRGLREFETHNQDNLVKRLLVFDEYRTSISTRYEVLHAESSINENFCEW